jgi:hypothetical protein
MPAIYAAYMAYALRTYIGHKPIKKQLKVKGPGIWCWEYCGLRVTITLDVEYRSTTLWLTGVYKLKMKYSGLLSNEEVFCDLCVEKISVIVCHVVSEEKKGD